MTEERSVKRELFTLLRDPSVADALYADQNLRLLVEEGLVDVRGVRM